MFKITWETTGLASMDKKDAKRIAKDAVVKMGNEWADDFLPRHFDGSQQNRYHLRERSHKYINHVEKHFPDWEPLVASGSMKNAALASHTSTPIKSDDELAVKVGVRLGHPVQKYVAQEVKKINKNEIEKMAKDLRDEIIKQISELPKKSGS